MEGRLGPPSAPGRRQAGTQARASQRVEEGEVRAGPSRQDQGLDLVGGGGIVQSIMDGTVIDANKAGGNNVVKIKHADGLISTYWHMYANDILVNTGDTVTAGQQLGVMGNSGDSVGTHLHIELDISEVEDRAYYESTYIVGTGGWNPGQRIDPQDFFKKNGLEGF